MQSKPEKDQQADIDYQRHPELMDSRHLNNFYTICAGGYHRDPMMGAVEGISATMRTTLQDKFNRRMHLPLAEIVKPDPGEYSPLRLSQNGQEFFDAIDAATEEAGIPLEAIRLFNETLTRWNDMISELQRGSPVRSALEKERGEVFRILNVLLVSVYKKLREKGYSHGDLWR
jgi:hypothetical protein